MTAYMKLLRFMRNVFFIVFILTILPVTLFSQELNLVLEPGIGTYGMKDLKEFNTMNLNSLTFDAKITDNFPNYWSNKILLQYSMKKFLTFGIACSYQSTGSRISRVDYSGEYFFDTKIRAFSPGVMAEFYIPLNNFRFSFCNEVGIDFSKLRLNEYIKINSELKEDDYSFTSENWYYEPTVKLSYPILFFRLGITTGYLLELKKGIVVSSDNQNIKLSDGELVTSDWSGARFGISLSINLLQIFKSTNQNINPP